MARGAGRWFAWLPAVLVLVGCGGRPTLEPVDQVDLPRFMGDWYVIAHIPTFVEDEAYNAVESYRLEPDGSVATTFTFNQGGFDGELKEMNPRGFPDPAQNNAVWGMQFIWPFKGDYRVAYLDNDYSITIIGRNKRDYVWLMSRSKTMPEARYRDMVDRIEAMGYDISELRRVPQR
ncbi:lipocalin family protein [Marinihelvus fidelis]|uniref:Outer membrane lipoprotein Blc n=1 Tax=Marinihelvus fidelis TaxID=2613842 RepID=A0A5N0TID9_9GAMM|nr:lipocalin family protein [Marinihelvus fidelis]KAA9134194.1 lipocalin family protein [Marinihelvus fidelis]